MKNCLISILIQNEPGALSRVCGLFSARSYNINSLCVSITNDASVSCIIINTVGDEKKIEQITKQINKLVEVLKVTALSPNNAIVKQLSLVRLKIENEKQRQTLFQAISTFSATLIEALEKIYIIEILGSDEHVDAFLSCFLKNVILEVIRTGSIGLKKK